MKNAFKNPIILDGGMGRELQSMGAPFRQPEWSAQALIESPQFVSQVHNNFAESGAQIITTNTYALVPFHIGETCYIEQGEQLIQLAAKLARECVNAHPGTLVAGCIPPVLGSYRPDLFAIDKARPLIEKMIFNQQKFVDIWLAETISSISEATLIKQLTERTAKPTWIAFTINDEITNDATLRSGELVYDAVSQIAGHHVSAILFNCSRSEVMETALINAKKALHDKGLTTQILLGVYANNFPPIGDLHQANNGVNMIREDMPPTKYAQFAMKWINAGASIIGGCCGISPAHIKALAQIEKV